MSFGLHAFPSQMSLCHVIASDQGSEAISFFQRIMSLLRSFYSLTMIGVQRFGTFDI